MKQEKRKALKIAANKEEETVSFLLYAFELKNFNEAESIPKT